MYDLVRCINLHLFSSGLDFDYGSHNLYFVDHGLWLSNGNVMWAHNVLRI